MIKQKKKYIIVFVTTFLVLIFLLAYFIYQKPIKTYNRLRRQSLFLTGTKEVYFGSFHGYMKGECFDKSCQCHLFIHGLGDLALTWTTVFNGFKLKELKNKKLIAINLPGSEKTKKEKKIKDYDVYHLAHKIKEEVLTQCPSWRVIGNSLGGWVSFYVAQDLRVNELVLENAAGVSGDYQVVYDIFNNPSNDNIKELQKRAYSQSLYLPDFLVQALKNRLLSLPIASYLKAQSKREFLDDELKEFSKKTWILWGLSDQMLPLEMGQKFHHLLKNSEYVPLKDCGHLPHKECFEKVKTYF